MAKAEAQVSPNDAEKVLTLYRMFYSSGAHRQAVLSLWGPAVGDALERIHTALDEKGEGQPDPSLVLTVIDECHKWLEPPKEIVSARLNR